jgi:hypothetical protein
MDIVFLHHITNIDNLENIIVSGLKPNKLSYYSIKQDNEIKFDDLFIWFDYIGYCNNKIKFSYSGFNTAHFNDNDIIFVLNYKKFMKLKSKFVDAFIFDDCLINIAGEIEDNFSNEYKKYAIWSLKGKNNDISICDKIGGEYVLRIDTELQINNLLEQIIIFDHNTDKYVRSILNKHKLYHVPVIKYNNILNDKIFITEQCNILNDLYLEEIEQLADDIGIKNIKNKNKKELCILISSAFISGHIEKSDVNFDIEYV